MTEAAKLIQADWANTHLEVMLSELHGPRGKRSGIYHFFFCTTLTETAQARENGLYALSS